MDSHDVDIEFLKGLAGKYKKTSINKNDIYRFGTVMLFLGGITLFSTVSALTLKITNIKLENTLAQYNEPSKNQLSVNMLPSPFPIENVVFDLDKPLPDLTFTYVDDVNKTCNVAKLELPPTLSQLGTCKADKGNAVRFANEKYSF